MTEAFGVRDAASLLSGSPQSGVTNYSYLTATGRLLYRTTWQVNTRLEYAMFTQDRLGHRASMTRYQNAASGTDPLTSSWHTNSLGQVVELDEPDSPAQFSVYSDWGELTETNRTVNGSLKRVVQKYDALGRLVHSEQQTAGVVDPETVHDYAYDTAVQVAPQVTATNVLGRLARATWPTGSVSYSYDGLGRNNAQVFTDAQGGNYVEKHTFHDDGSPSALDLFLPDTAFADEHVAYTFDSAGRGRNVTYSNGSDKRDLYQATTIDPFGRVRQASYGPATYTADYADVGRRLMRSVAVASPAGSRSISYTGFDPLGRERGRKEIKPNPGPVLTVWTYDALGRLTSADETVTDGSRTDGQHNTQSFTHDPLGNLLSLSNSSNSSGSILATGEPTVGVTTLSYSTSDRDRICRIAFDSDSGTACNVTYDELGSILSQPSQPTRTGSRQYTYLIDGSVRSISDGHGTVANFRYDAFGQVQELDLTSNTSTDVRADRHFGALFTKRLETTSGSSGTPALTRKIPLHDGSLATRHTSSGPWTFEYGEQRGNRFFTDQTGAFVQDVDYQPFGEAISTGAQPGSQLYSNKQWNGGDSLAALGVSQLGARIYDPAIGRFISRDPLLIPRTATTTNPYAFADNDPVNGSDPTGLTGTGRAPICPGPECPCQKPGSDGCKRPGNEPDRPPTTPGGPGAGPATPPSVPPVPPPLPESSPSLPQGIPTPMPTPEHSGDYAPNGVGAPRSDATLFGGSPFDYRPNDSTPPFVQDWKQRIDPHGLAPVGETLEPVTEHFQSIADSAVGTALDTVPFYGTYRICGRGDALGCALSMTSDLFIVGKVLRGALSLGVAIGITGERSQLRLLPGLNIADKQFGKKVAQHAADYQKDPRVVTDRAWIRSHIEGIVGGYEEVRQGYWRGGGNGYLFYRRGQDLVITKPSGDFVTILRNGSSNSYFNPPVA